MNCVKLRIGLENLSGVFAFVLFTIIGMASDQDKTRQDDLFNLAQPAFFASFEIDKNYSLTLPR